MTHHKLPKQIGKESNKVKLRSGFVIILPVQQLQITLQSPSSSYFSASFVIATRFHFGIHSVNMCNFCYSKCLVYRNWTLSIFLKKNGLF